MMNWYIPGMGYQENYLPAEQQLLGHEVSIITSDRIPLFDGYENNVGNLIPNRVIGTGEYRDGDIVVHRLPTICEVNDGGLIVYSGLMNLLTELKPDVVHAHGPYNPSTLLSILHSRKRDYKIFIDDHSNEQNYHLNTISKRLYINLVKSFYTCFGKKVAVWMPIDEPAKKIIQANFGIPDENVRVIPLGINTRRFHQSKEMRNETRRSLSIEEDECLIVTAGKLDESKDIDVLLMAFIKVLERTGKIKLLIVGGGSALYMEKLHEIALKSSAEGSVIFMDFVSNEKLPNLFNAADIGVWPGTPTITAVEALATGLPIIIPMDYLSYERHLDNRAALGFRKNDIVSLVDSITSLVIDSQLRTRLSNNAIILAKEQLSWAKIAQDCINIYTA